MKNISLKTVMSGLLLLVLPHAGFSEVLANRQVLASAQAYQLDAQALEQLLALNNDCGVCDANISGKWTYSLLKDNVPYKSETVSFVQTGKSVKAVGMHYTLVGSLRGQWLDLTLVVSGEELEGYVMKVGASVDGKRITGVFQDSFGDVGSFVAVKK